MSETTNRQVSSAIIYGIEDRPPFKEAFFAALQHLLAIFVAIITPPLIIAGALNLDLETTGFLVSMALLPPVSRLLFNVDGLDLSEPGYYVFKEQVFRLSARLYLRDWRVVCL